MSDNPVQALLATIGSLDALEFFLIFERTNITDVPDWVQPLVEQRRDSVQLSAYGPPYCDRVIAAMASDPAA